MANSTYQATVDRILQNHGQASTPSDAGVSFDTNSLDKIQMQVKLFVDCANRMLFTIDRPRFLRRTFSITTGAFPGTPNKYAVDATTTPERFEKDTFFNVTTNYGYGPFEYFPYKYWQQMYPEGETVSGCPRAWYLLPPDGSGTDYVAFSSPPDNVYTITYQGYLRPAALVNHGDVIAWPTDFEHQLWLAAAPFVETLLSEGKAPDFAQYVQPVISQIKQNSLGPVDETPGIDLGISIPGLIAGVPVVWDPNP